MDSGKKMIQREPEHYYKINYDSKERFCSYWHQIHEVLLLRPREVLEIGIGNAFVSRYLRERGVNIITLDIDKELKPDVVGSVLNIPFQDKSFTAVACYELLEHIQYSNFAKALLEISRVSKQYVILSVPDASRVYRIYIRIPKVAEIKRLLPLPKKKTIHEFDGEHHWEIGKSGYPLSKIAGDINKVGLKIKTTYRVFEWPYHRFFILEKEV